MVWELGISDDDGDLGYMLDIATDSDGEPHLSYQDADRSKIEYAVDDYALARIQAALRV